MPIGHRLELKKAGNIIEHSCAGTASSCISQWAGADNFSVLYMVQVLDVPSVAQNFGHRRRIYTAPRYFSTGPSRINPEIRSFYLAFAIQRHVVRHRLFFGFPRNRLKSIEELRCQVLLQSSLECLSSAMQTFCVSHALQFFKLLLKDIEYVFPKRRCVLLITLGRHWYPVSLQCSVFLGRKRATPRCPFFRWVFLIAS